MCGEVFDYCFGVVVGWVFFVVGDEEGDGIFVFWVVGDEVFDGDDY